MMCTAMNVLFRTSTLASRAEYERTFIKGRPFLRNPSGHGKSTADRSSDTTRSGARRFKNFTILPGG
jgi:hypothetical protein